MRKILLALLFSGTAFSISPEKQAYINLEMANYFFQGKDFDNALKYYGLADGKVQPEELSVLICRNVAMIHMIKETKPKAVTVLEKCINDGNVSLMESSQAYRDVIKMYAEIKADEVNPKIQDGKRQAFEAQQKAMMQRAQPVNTAPKAAPAKAPAKAADDSKVKIGF